MAGLDRIAVTCLQGCCRRIWGFAPAVIPHMVAARGPLRTLAWFARNMPRYFSTLHRLGGIRHHLACMVISLYNGCYYCAYGHGYALELLYLRERARLFPLDAATLAEWPAHEPRELRLRLLGVLQEAGLHAEARWVDTTLGLIAGNQPVDEDEVRLAHLVGMVGEMNKIATTSGVQPDGAQNPINKNKTVKACHAALRALV